MKYNSIILTSFVFVYLSSTMASAGWFGGPSNYDECILENMKGVTSDVAARLVRRSCLKKFPMKKKHFTDIDLPSSILEKIDGKAGVTQFGDFKGSIFNGNTDWTITSLTIRVVDNITKKHRDYKTSVYQEGYVLSLELPPLLKGAFTIKPYELPEDKSWSIISGRGYKNSNN